MIGSEVVATYVGTLFLLLHPPKRSSEGLTNGLPVA